MPVFDFDRALVLGPGGLVGTAWMAGLAGGLRLGGVDLGEADLIVGTSAGAIVGALLATGQDPGRLASAARPDAYRLKADPERMSAVFAVLGDRGLEPGEARRRVGRLALERDDPAAEEALLAGREALIGADVWPERRLVLTAVDATTGEPVAWDRESGVSLVRAVAASSAFPGAAPAVAIDGRRYMDGALRAGANADLAAGARKLVVLEPMAHLSPREQVNQELAAAGAQSVVAVGPDSASVRAFGADMGDLAAWEPAYQAGFRQAGDVDAQLSAVWSKEAD